MATPPPPNPGGYREIFRNRNWILWQTSYTATYVGYAIYAIAIPWFAYRYSGNFLIVGLVLFVEIGIYTLTFLVGPLVDRARDKRTIYLVCFPAQAVAAAVLGFLIGTPYLSFPLLIGLIAFISFLWDFTWAANNAAPRLLLNVDQLFRASGLTTALEGTTQLIGTVIGAFLLVVIGLSADLLLYAGLLAAATVLVIPLSIPSPPMSPGGYREDYREGWRYFRGSTGKTLRQLAGMELVRGFFGTAPSVLIVVAAARLFAGGSGAYGILIVAWVIGTVSIGLVLGEWNPRHRIGAILISSALTSGLLVALAVLPFWGLFGDGILWALLGASETAYLIAFYVYLRGAYPPESIARITSNLYLFAGVTSSAGVAVVGAIADVWPLTEIGIVIAAGFFVLGGLLLRAPEIRRLMF
jgi:hypothetical protein